jgi:hypothetical protein
MGMALNIGIDINMGIEIIIGMKHEREDYAEMSKCRTYWHSVTPAPEGKRHADDA